MPVSSGATAARSVAGGLGISSARDIPGLERVVAAARRAKKRIAFHAGERDAGDVDAALAFEPDLIIHATHATKKQLRHCAEHEIPIVGMSPVQLDAGRCVLVPPSPGPSDDGAGLHGLAGDG